MCKVIKGICLLAFFIRLYAVIRYESIIHEFDPWFNYRATQKMVTMGFYDFLNWFDETGMDFESFPNPYFTSHDPK